MLFIIEFPFLLNCLVLMFPNFRILKYLQRLIQNLQKRWITLYDALLKHMLVKGMRHYWSVAAVCVWVSLRRLIILIPPQLCLLKTVQGVYKYRHALCEILAGILKWCICDALWRTVISFATADGNYEQFYLKGSERSSRVRWNKTYLFPITIITLYHTEIL